MEPVLKPGVLLGCGEREGARGHLLVGSGEAPLHQEGPRQGHPILTHLPGGVTSKL